MTDDVTALKIAEMYKTLFIKLQLRLKIFLEEGSSKLLEWIVNFGPFWPRDLWRYSIKNDKNVYSIKISTNIQIFVSSRLMQREIALVPRLPLFENCIYLP